MPRELTFGSISVCFHLFNGKQVETGSSGPFCCFGTMEQGITFAHVRAGSCGARGEHKWTGLLAVCPFALGEHTGKALLRKSEDLLPIRHCFEHWLYGPGMVSGIGGCSF